MLADTERTFGFSARALDRIARVARTIADLAACDAIRAEHVAEAIQVPQPGTPRRPRGLGNRRIRDRPESALTGGGDQGARCGRKNGNRFGRIERLRAHERTVDEHE